MKIKRRFIACLLIAVAAVFSASCAPPQRVPPDGDRALMLKEAEAGFNFFWDFANTDESSDGFGLIRDRMSQPSYGSMASVGFGLALLPAAVEYGWITEAEGRARAVGTLATIINMEHFSGFYYHFVYLNDGSRYGGSEISVIDSAILLCGAITAGEYFGGAVKEKAAAVYDRTDWNFYIGSNNGRQQFHMSCKPSGTGYDFSGWWDVYAEQLIMYVLGAGAVNEAYRMPLAVYNGFTRLNGSYTSKASGETYSFINSWFGALFTYQFSHAFIDFRGYSDPDGTDWFDNSVKASLASYYFAQDNKDIYPAFSETVWGISACDTPDGYNGGMNGLGTPPSDFADKEYSVTGKSGTVTIPSYAAVASMPFTPAQSLAAFKNYMSMKGLRHEKYGLYDSFNTEKEWICDDFVGIDKGITGVMLVNYLDDTVWKYFMENANVKNGIERLGFVKNAREREAA